METSRCKGRHVAGYEDVWSNMGVHRGGDVAGGRSESAVVGRLLLEHVSLSLSSSDTLTV